MSDNKTNNVMDQMTPAEEMALMVEGLYRSVNSDLQKMKKELLNEMKFTAAQSSSMYDSLQKDTASAADSAAKSVDSITNEMKYVYQQNQAIYEDVSAKLNERIDALEEKLAVLEEIEQQLKLLNNKGDETDYDTVSEMVKDKVVDSIPVYEELDYEKLSDSVSEKAEAAFAEQNQQVLSAVAAIPVAENVDYSRIVEEVGDRVLEILREQKDAEESIVEEAEEPAEVAAEVDYDRIIYGSAEKVVESLPYQDKVDYDRIERMIANSSATDAVNPETIAELVVEKMGKEDDFAYEVVIDGENVDKIVEGISEGFDFETLSDKIAEKVKVPEEVLPELDYDKLSDLVASKVAVPEPSMEIDYERLADLVASKLAAPDVDYDRLAEAVVAKMSEKEVEEKYDVLLDEEGIDAIAEKVVEKLDFSNARFEVYTNAEPTEEVVEEVVEEVAVVEEPVEEVVEEVVEEPATEPAAEEVAVAAEPTYKVSGDELVDAETGLVIRLKRSFTAKMKQSEENVKGFYSALKNELTSYKKVNSHVSWHGDRFNLGRDTIARMNICGKTLCLYLDLDPENPEFKQTVYHQKNVTGQKAYEGTPFMVKIKSDAAVKKATRLVTALAEKYEAEKEEEFVAVDYAEEFAYETTTKLLEDGLIRTTKEKKVALDF